MCVCRRLPQVADAGTSARLVNQVARRKIALQPVAKRAGICPCGASMARLQTCWGGLRGRYCWRDGQMQGRVLEVRSNDALVADVTTNLHTLQLLSRMKR